MTLSLLSLAQNELEIYKRTQAGLNSNVADVLRDDHLVLDNYRAIHQEYLNIFNEADEESTRLEALKRLIFLNWNLVVESDWLTGIDDLDEDAVFAAYQILDHYLKEKRLDDELLWMLSHYAVWDYAILDVAEGRLEELTAFVKGIDENKKKFPLLEPAGTFDDRGQMGIYWNSMIKPA